MKQQELLLRTAFACMACDGTIATEEVELIQQLHDKKHLFGDVDVKAQLETMIEDLKRMGNDFVKAYFDTLASAKLTETEELDILRVAAQTIQSDQVIEYSEIKFFKMIRSYMKVEDDTILAQVTEIDEDYLAQDIIDREMLFSSYFENVELSKIELQLPER